jgi:hypothetical protein
MDVISERLQQSLTLQAAQRELGEEACSRPVAGGTHHGPRVPSSALPPRSVPASASALVPHTKPYGASHVHQRRSFVRPGGVASAWARCVGVQRTVNVRKRPTGDFDGASGDGGAVLTGQHVSGLADMSAFLRQRKRCVLAPGCGPLWPPSDAARASVQAHRDGGSQADGPAPGTRARRGEQPRELAHGLVGASPSGSVPRTAAGKAPPPPGLKPQRLGRLSVVWLPTTGAAVCRTRRRAGDALPGCHFERGVGPAARAHASTPDFRPSPFAALLCPCPPQMKIVCLLRHNELWPLLATSRRLRQAAAAAISVHFNFCTPEPQRDERDAVLPVLRSPSPRYVHAALLAQREAWGVPDAPFRHHARRRRPTKAVARTGTAMLGLPAPVPPAAGWRQDLMLRSPGDAAVSAERRAAGGGAATGAAGTPSEGGTSHLVVPAAWTTPSVVMPAQLEMTPPPPGHKYGTRLSFDSVRGGGDDHMEVEGGPSLL